MVLQDNILILWNYNSSNFHNHASKSHPAFFFQPGMRKLRFGKSWKKKIGRRKSSCSNRKDRKREERMLALPLRVLWRLCRIPRTKFRRYFRLTVWGRVQVLFKK